MMHIAKSLLQRLIHFRLRRLPLGRKEAAFWTRAFSAYPSLFRGFGMDLEFSAEVFPDIVMKLGFRDRIQKTIIARGHWDPHTAGTLKQLVREGDTFIDVGANIGYFSLFASTLVGRQGRVFAFEPSLRALAKLTDHLESNGVDNVIVNSCGLADRRSLLTFYRSDASNIGKSSLGLDEDERQASETILAVSLDEHLDGLDVVPRMIKIDIEGAELLALRGMQRLLQETEPYVLCEVIDDYLAKLGSTADAMHAYMAQLGYESYIASDGPGIAAWRRLEDWSQRTGDDDILFAKQPLPATLLVADNPHEVAHEQS